MEETENVPRDKFQETLCHPVNRKKSLRNIDLSFHTQSRNIDVCHIISTIIPKQAAQFMELEEIVIITKGTI